MEFACSQGEISFHYPWLLLLYWPATPLQCTDHVPAALGSPWLLKMKYKCSSKKKRKESILQQLMWSFLVPSHPGSRFLTINCFSYSGIRFFQLSPTMTPTKLMVGTVNKAGQDFYDFPCGKMGRQASQRAATLGVYPLPREKDWVFSQI